MGKTFKDRKDYPKYKKAKRKPLDQNYVAVKQNGPDDEHFVGMERDECLLEDEGDHCPYCGESTDFERGFLQCSECGWVDFKGEAVVLEEAA